MSGATLLHLDVGERSCLLSGATGQLIFGALNAVAVPFRGDIPDGPDMHISALEAGDLAIGQPRDELAIELSVARAASTWHASG